ncbi:MAG: type II secretion system F family protein, partial [Polyangiales bacterium]
VLAGTVATIGTSVFAYYLISAERSPLQPVVGRYEARLEGHTRFLLLGYSGAKIARVQIVACSIAGGLSVLTWSPVFVTATILLACGPPLALSRQHQARVGRLERQLDTWLLMLANALRATPSVGDAVASTTRLVPAPFSEEVDLLVKEIRLGVPLRRATASMARRIGSHSVSAALTTIAIAAQTGGDLAGTLERNAAALREVARLDGVLRAKTAEGRGQVALLASMPFVLFASIRWLDPGYFAPILRHDYGHGILATCGSLWVLASLWATHIVKVDL